MQTKNNNINFEETYEDLVLNTKEFPRGFIPFAAEQGVDYFLYSLRPQDQGSIFFNQSDYYDDPSRFLVFLSSTRMR